MKEQKSKTFRLQGYSFFLTYPKCGEDKQVLLEHLRTKGTLKAYVIAREKHKDGDSHLHAYAKYEKKINTVNKGYFDFMEYHGNYQTAKNPLAVQKYCKKDGDYIEEGINIQAKAMARESKQSYIAHKLIIEKVELKDLVEQEPTVIYDYEKLDRNLTLWKMQKQDIPDYYPRQCYWITGEPGIGKSRWIRDNYSGAYNKPQNKWWNGYSGQMEVVLDDLDSKELGHLLKIWGDNYSFIAETKGSQIKPQYTKLFITSNYTPQDLWKFDEAMQKAIERRFRLTTIKNGELVDLNTQQIIGNI